MSKYYTPEIEELVLGLEVEYKDPTMVLTSDPPQELWRKAVLTGWRTIIDLFDGGDGMLRVKHLDRDDIESLGWVNKFTHKNKNIALTKKTTERTRSVNEHTDIILNPTNSWIVVSQGDEETGYDEWVTRFSGTIKNKSELKRLLKQLGI